MEIHMVYITVGNMEEAEAIGKALVESRQVACVNLIDNMHSMYWWEGKVQSDNEVILIAKTTGDQVDAVIENVKKIHSYECPCIISLPVSKGNPAFLEWIETETRS